MASNPLFSAVVILLLFFNSCQPNPTSQSHFFDAMNNMLSGDSLSNWDPNTTYCTYNGVTCDDRRNVIEIDISGWSLKGTFPTQVCSYLPQLRVLRLGHNNFHGNLPRGITNCSFLEELNATSSYFSGSLPDFSRLTSIKILDLSYNLFSGSSPVSITNLTTLEVLNLNENSNLDTWELPSHVSRMTKMRTMILTTCMLRGEIPPSVGNMTSLIDLELTGNYLMGRIPKELGFLQNVEYLELYYNQLEGEIPWEIGNLTRVKGLDLSVNKLSGGIPESICMLPNLLVFQLYTNNLVGEIPSVISNSTTLNTLSLYQNLLTGEIPQNLGRSSAVEALDLSENRLSGRLPEGLCRGGKLNYLLVLQNMLSGEIPESYTECKSLVRFRVSSNKLEGDIPEGILSLPHAYIIDVAYNKLTGLISRSVQNARNLSQLFMQGNMISGVVPTEISFAVSLVKIDLSGNLLSGPIPSEIGNLRKLNLLMLQGNRLCCSIPDSLSSLKSLNVLDLSRNSLTGEIPESFSKLLPNSLNFSNNNLSGEIPFLFIKGGLLESFSGNPNLCVPSNLDSQGMNFSTCLNQTTKRKKMINCVWIMGIAIGILALGTVLFLKRWLSRERQVIENEEPHTLSSSFYSYDVKSFHRVSFDQREIIEAMVDKNIVGFGGSGTVYKIELNNGDAVAVKRLWSQKAKDSRLDEQLILDKELKTEVETLGSIRHKNIVKLFCYFSSVDCSLLVYEFMSNGNLWDALHRGKAVLDWPTRHQIALGVAQGLAYLHHDLMPPIIHRDIKSTNILLDDDYLPKVADFGIAKVLQAKGSRDSTTSVIAGTYGYLAPEYAYSSKATTKCDIYSFGVVLMELVTGKKPVEAEFGENKSIICWVSSKVETKEGAADVLDKRVFESYKEDMMKVLGIAMRCTCQGPALRPAMNEVVQQLIEADPCKFRCCNNLSSDKLPKQTQSPH